MRVLVKNYKNPIIATNKPDNDKYVNTPLYEMNCSVADRAKVYEAIGSLLLVVVFYALMRSVVVASMTPGVPLVVGTFCIDVFRFGYTVFRTIEFLDFLLFFVVFFFGFK